MSPQSRLMAGLVPIIVPTVEIGGASRPARRRRLATRRRPSGPGWPTAAAAAKLGEAVIRVRPTFREYKVMPHFRRRRFKAKRNK